MKSPSFCREVLVVLILITGSSVIGAQTASPGLSPEKGMPLRHLTLGIGLTAQRLQDPAVSPMVYRGVPFTLQLGFEKWKKRHISRLDLTVDIGALRSANATDARPMRSQFYRVDFQYAYLHLLNPDAGGALHWFAGGKYRWHNTIRLTQQNDTGFISFFISNSIAASGGLRWHFPVFGKQATLAWQGDLPLLSHVIRPSYLNLYNYLDPEHDWLAERLEESRFVALNKFPGFTSLAELYYPIAGENYLKFSYQWSFYHYDFLHEVNAGSNSFLLTFLMRI